MLLQALPLAVLLAAAQAPEDGPGRVDVLPSPDTPPRPSERLMAYAGEHVSVRYAPGALDRALHVTNRLDLVVGELEKWLDMSLPLTALVLDRAEWDRAALTRPYGLPLPLSIGSVAVPGVGDAGTVRKWKTWLGTELPPVGGVPLVGTAEQASTLLLADVFLQVEVCEQLLSRTALARSDPWIRGVLSHLAALSLWNDNEPSRSAELIMIFTRLRGQIPPLLAFEAERLRKGEPRLTTERWLLAEAHLFEGASVAHAAGGSKTFKKLLKTMRKGEAPTRGQVLAVYPGLGTWLEALPAEAGIR